jgi:hypothetical protein
MRLRREPNNRSKPTNLPSRSVSQREHPGQMESSWWRSSASLRAAQHEAIVQLILENTQPPPAFGKYDIYVVMYHLSQLPESKLKPLLEEQQWQQMQAKINQYQAMIHFLIIQNGLIPKDDIAETQETQK